MSKKSSTKITRREFNRAALASAAGASALAVGIPALASQKVKMTVGYHSLWATVGEIFETLRHTNILELHGIEATWEKFTYGGPLGEGYVAGKIDNIIAADVPVLRGLARRTGTVLHRTHDWRFAVVAQPDFKGGLADLKGKKFAGPFGTTVFPRTVRRFVEAGIKDPFKEITIINQDVAEQANALQGKLVDAVVTWDPTTERLVSQKIGKIIWESQPGDGAGWQGLSAEFIKKHGEDVVVRYLKAWIMATWWASNNLELAHKWFGETSRIGADLLQVSARADRYLKAPTKDIKTMNFELLPTEVASAQEVMDFMLERKLLQNKLEVAPLVDMKYMRKAQADIAAGKHEALSKIKVV